MKDEEKAEEEENNVGILFKKSYEDIEKENAELKNQLEVTNKENERIRRTMLTYSECITEHQNTIKRKDEENEELKEQIEQLSNDNHVLKTSFITQQAQIEKMKCCGNCVTGQEPVTKEKILFCSSCRGLDEQKENIIYKYWKVAE